MSPAVLIVGASRGIGLGLVREYAGAGWRVHATTRTPEQHGLLGDVLGDVNGDVNGDANGDVVIHGLDVRSAEQIEALRKALADVALDVLIHGAGVYRGTPRAEMMAVNAEAPIRVAESLLDRVAASAQRKIALLTSQLGARHGRTGSLGDYGDSKAALNDAFRERATEWSDAGITGIVIHPGWVRTDMGGRSAPVSVEDSARGIRTLLERLTPDMHGRFWTWEGREHAW